MISSEAKVILEVGFNELYRIQQKDCIIEGINNLPGVNSLSTFSFILSDTSSNGNLLSSTLNLLRRVIPLLPSDYDFKQFYQQIISVTTDVNFIQIVAYEKIMALIILGDYLNGEILIELYSKVLDGYFDVMRIMHHSMNENLFYHLHLKLKNNKEVWNFIGKILLGHKMKITILRFIMENAYLLDINSIQLLMPIFFKLIVSYSNEKEFTIAEYCHAIICYILTHYKQTTKVYLEQYIFMIINLILSFNNDTPVKYFSGYIKSNEPTDIRNVLYQHLDVLLNQPNFVMSTYINFDCDPHASNLCQFIIENLVKIQLSYPVVVPQIRKVLMNMLVSIENGEGSGKEIELKNQKEKDEKIALSFNRNIQSGLELYKKTYYPTQESLTPKQIAELFKKIKGIDKQFIGEFFDKRKELPIAVLKEYLFEFISNENLLQGFIAFVQSMKLPKETNSINHMFEDYAKYFAELHPGKYSSDEVLFMISAMLLLNVELHHPVMKNKRTKTEFARAMKEMTPKVSEDIFNEMYDYIDHNEFHIANEEPTMDISRIEDDIVFRQKIMNPFIDSLDYCSKSVDEVVTKIIKPLVQNLQTQFELASTTTALDQSCQSFIDFASLAQKLNNTVMADFLANNLIKVSTICQNPDLNTFCYDVKPIRASLLILELFDKFHPIFNKSIPSICQFMSALKHLDLFPSIEESKPSELSKLFTPQQTQKQQSSWLSSWLGGESQTEESIEKIKKLFKTKSYAKHIICEVTQKMDDTKFIQFTNGFYTIIIGGEDGNNHNSVSALVLLHFILTFNWGRSQLIWNDIVENIIKQIDKKIDNPLISYLPILPLSLVDVNEGNNNDEIVRETIKLLCVVSEEFIKKNEDFVTRVIIKIIQAMINETNQMTDLLNLLIIHTSQTTSFIKIMCSEKILLVKEIINNPVFLSEHSNQMTTFLCNIYKTIASTQFFKQYIESLSSFYSKIVEYIKLNDQYNQVMTSNFQSISLFFFVACCHPTAEIRQISLTTLQTITPIFFNSVPGEVILYFFKSMSTFIGGICSKKRNDIPLRCVEMATKIFLGGHLVIIEKNNESWFIMLQIIQKMKENGDINEEIKELMKNVMFVLICEEKLTKGSEIWDKTWKIIEGILNENDFVPTAPRDKVEQVIQEPKQEEQTKENSELKQEESK